MRGLTHHDGNEEKIAKVCKIDAYCAEQFAYFLDKMKSLKEGENTLLDNSMVLLGNGNGDAARHDHYNCMTVLAGRGCGCRSWIAWASASSGTATAPHGCRRMRIFTHAPRPGFEGS